MHKNMQNHGASTETDPLVASRSVLEQASLKTRKNVATDKTNADSKTTPDPLGPAREVLEQAALKKRKRAAASRPAAGNTNHNAKPDPREKFRIVRSYGVEDSPLYTGGTFSGTTPQRVELRL